MGGLFNPLLVGDVAAHACIEVFEQKHLWVGRVGAWRQFGRGTFRGCHDNIMDDVDLRPRRR